MALFSVVAIAPTIIVGILWYLYSRTEFLNFVALDPGSFILGILVVGAAVAIALSAILARKLSDPVHDIHIALSMLAIGKFDIKLNKRGTSELAEIGRNLDKVASKLEYTLSEASSETALIEAERGKLNSVLNSMTDGVFALDRSGRIILFNKAACELTGRTIGEVAGQLAEKMMPFRSGGELVMTRWLARGAGAEHKIGHWQGLELYRADGHSLYVNVEAVVLKDDPNGIAALITFHDLTKAHQLEEMKIDFVALAAHELRTPLTAIKGYLDILTMEAKGLTKTQQGFLNQAVVSAGQLGGLIHNLLNVSKIEHGELSYQAELMDYGDFLHSLLPSIQARATQQNRILELHLPAESLTIMGDPSALREVIDNLVNNAVNSTPAVTGNITIEVVAHRTSIDTSVVDNGIGIPPSAIPHLFTKFFRVDELRSTNRGTGLGLYICRAIMEAHGGSISVQSTVAKGSAFTFILPRQSVATRIKTADNKHTITRGAHGWIKDHTVR